MTRKIWSGDCATAIFAKWSKIRIKYDDDEEEDMNQDRYGTNDKGNGEGQGGHNKNNNAIKMTTTMQYDDDNNNNDTNDNWEEKQDLKPAAIDNDVLLTQQQIGDKALQNISGYVSGYDDVHIGEVQESLQRSMVNYDGFCMD